MGLVAPKLGRLERIDLRSVWESEDNEFTPWLAQPNNLDLLGEAIDIELEHEATEKNVGPFRADILCKDVATEHWVLIENQLGRTDHTHLGQLLTYAAGLDAVTIVWIASPFTDEHRAALTWLNEITDEHFRFFGLEVEAWRIGDSPPAPKFNVVVKPNDWTRTISDAVTKAALSPNRQAYQEYWAQFRSFLEQHQSSVRPTKPLPQQWMQFSIGRAYLHLVAAFSVRGRQLRAHLAVTGPEARAYFNLLNREREQIDRELGRPADWRELDDVNERQIGWRWENVDPMDRADWSRQHQLLYEHLELLWRVFRERVRSLNADDWRPPEGVNG